MRVGAIGRIGILFASILSTSCDRRPSPAPAPPQESDELAKIVITPKKLSVALDPYPVADIPEDAHLGLAADVKVEGRRSFFITPLAQALGGTDAAKACPRVPASLAGETLTKDCPLVIVADAKTSYRVVSEVVFTAVMSRFANLALAVDVGGAPSTVAISVAVPPCGKTPQPGGSCGGDGRGEPTAITIEKDGFAVTLDGTPVAPGCTTTRPGVATITVPVASGRLDFAGLATCIRKIRDLRKAATWETVAWLGAEPSVALADVVRAIDAIRGAGGEGMFTDVALLLPRDDARSEP